MDRLLSWWKGSGRAQGPAQGPEAGPEEPSGPAPLPVDHRVGGYQITGPLGQGGTATVYAAQDGAGQEAAVKIPLRASLGDAEFVATFQREAELGVTLRHPSIVRVLAAGSYATPDFPVVPFFAMERLRGRDLKHFLREAGRLPQEMALPIARAVADALDWAHQRGVVHRDISPSNVFLTARRSVKVMDFGISAADTGQGGPRRGICRGTPEYFAPERVADVQSADPRVDLYALGCVLYEMLAGHPPFSADRPEEVLRLQVEAPVPPLPPEIPVAPGLRRILARLLEKDPERRYQSAREVLNALADLAG